MNVRFVSPHAPTAFDAEIAPHLTARAALKELERCDFLLAETPTRTYALVVSRTGKGLLPDQVLGDVAGENEVFEVVQATEGAGAVR